MDGSLIQSTSRSLIQCPASENLHLMDLHHTWITYVINSPLGFPAQEPQPSMRSLKIGRKKTTGLMRPLHWSLECWDYVLNKEHQQHYLCHNGNLRIGGHYYTMAQHGTHGWSITSKSQIHGIMIYFYLMIKVQSSHLNGVHLFWRLPLEHRNWQIYSTNRQVDYYE